ncbi:LysR family transcriptional regulator [Acidovorax sp. 69]|nr:LysR family transcriptional regulator [Acidovorax sp. 69]
MGCICFNPWLKMQAMQPLSHLESFVKSAESGSFSAAARLMGLTPAAVSKNVARLEAGLGVRLFQRSTRRLMLTEGGQRLLAQISQPLTALADAVDHAAETDQQPAGTLKVSMGQAFGRAYLVPLLTEFLQRYPAIQPDWRFENRQVDLIGEGFDAGIGGGLNLNPDMVARTLGPVHLVAVGSPALLKGRRAPRHPSDLAQWDGIARRTIRTGRIAVITLRNKAGEVAAAELRPRLVFDDPEAMCQAAMMGLGLTVLPMPFALPWLARGDLVRVLPGWWADAGPTSLYYPSKKLLPARTRVFVDFVVAQFSERGFAQRVRGD